MQDYMVIANSLPMWIAAALAVALVIFQAVLFARKSYATGKEIGLTTKQMNSAIKSSFITSLGPSLVILSGLLTLLVTIGGPMAWMRLSFIGSVMYELSAATLGVQAVGASFAEMTEVAFANAVWVMILGSVGWIIFATLTADKMETVQNKLFGKDPGLITIIPVAAMSGNFGNRVAESIVNLNNTTVASLCGCGIMALLIIVSTKFKIGWLKEWALAIALFGGMIIAALV